MLNKIVCPNCKSEEINKNEPHCSFGAGTEYNIPQASLYIYYKCNGCGEEFNNSDIMFKQSK